MKLTAEAQRRAKKDTPKKEAKAQPTKKNKYQSRKNK